LSATGQKGLLQNQLKAKLATDTVFRLHGGFPAYVHMHTALELAKESN
jgi:hypothetical protein